MGRDQKKKRTTVCFINDFFVPVNIPAVDRARDLHCAWLGTGPNGRFTLSAKRVPAPARPHIFDCGQDEPPRRQRLNIVKQATRNSRPRIIVPSAIGPFI
jgi:hypothetical protein